MFNALKAYDKVKGIIGKGQTTHVANQELNVTPVMDSSVLHCLVAQVYGSQATGILQ